MFINVHNFDGKIKNQYTPINFFNKQEKIELLNNSKSKFSKSESISMINIIIKDIDSHNGGSNFQNENNMDCSDILSDILSYKDLNNIMPLLEEQLSDNFLLGQCNAGRVIRLFQIWKCIY
jgi:hypothetical protein